MGEVSSVCIERGPLKFTVLTDKPLTKEQWLLLEPLARVMEDIEPSFHEPEREVSP